MNHNHVEANSRFHIGKERMMVPAAVLGSAALVAAGQPEVSEARVAPEPQEHLVMAMGQTATERSMVVSSSELDKYPSATAIEARRRCEPPYVPAFPGSRYKPSNREDMQKQLRTLKKAHSPDAKVTFRDIANAEFIGLNALADPAYAKAFTYANRHARHMPSARKLLRKDFDGPRCVTKKQLFEVSDLYDTLVEGLAPKAGRQISLAAQAAYQGLKAALPQFCRDLPSTASSPLAF